MSTAALVMAVYVAALATLTRLRPVPVRSRGVQLLKALLPSWRFFEDVGEVAVLRVRFGEADSEAKTSTDGLGAWREGLPRIERRLSALLLHAEGNHLHACESLLQLLLAEVGEAADGDDDPDGGDDDSWLARSVNYRLVDEVVRWSLREGRYADEAARLGSLRYQWKLCTRHPDGAEEDILLSPVEEA